MLQRQKLRTPTWGIRRGKIPAKESLGERRAVTVCIAGLFNWNYAQPGMPTDWGRVALLLSDRMITAGDVQYEPATPKIIRLAENAVVQFSGDYAIHSQALKDTRVALRLEKRPKPENVALIYGRAIQAIKRRHAEDLYLAPLGLNTDSFIAQQREMSDALASALLEKMHNYRGDDVEAIIIGTSEIPGVRNEAAQIYTVDSGGGVSCADDIGFAAIGIGAWHAKSQLMQSGYMNKMNFPSAIAALFAAKKAAEVAPGVGEATDIVTVYRDGKIGALWPVLQKRVADLYEEHDQQRRAGITKMSDALMQTIIDGAKAEEEADRNAKGQTGRNAQTDGSVSSPSAEISRGNEASE